MDVSDPNDHGAYYADEDVDEISGCMFGFALTGTPRVGREGATHFLRIYFTSCFKNKATYAFSTHFLRIFYASLKLCNAEGVQDKLHFS